MSERRYEYPTGEEETRAMIYALQGDSNMSKDEKAFCRDVIRRRMMAESESLLRFIEMARA